VLVSATEARETMSRRTRTVPPGVWARLDPAALLSVSIASTLAAVGSIRLASYQRGVLGAWLRESPLGFLAYQPDDYFNVRYFKVLASLSFVSFIYFTFRVLNRGHRNVFPADYPSHHRDLDFESPRLRLVLIAIINVQWVIQESYKFWTKNYPWSPLESWVSNAVVLAVSSALAFFGMKYLSFKPLLRPRPASRQNARL
jgi:hypothetical protein